MVSSDRGNYRRICAFNQSISNIITYTIIICRRQAIIMRERESLHRISESKTRKELIDPQLELAGWHLRDKSRVRIEIPVDGYDAAPLNGVTDYCLYRYNGEVIAIVEAKRTSHDPRLAQQQAEYYVTEITKHQSFQPFAFL